jgi:hypothetical protein
MSSAILYLAIVAIWACVLIPRWLRRDSAHGATVALADATAPDVPGVSTAPGASVVPGGSFVPGVSVMPASASPGPAAPRSAAGADGREHLDEFTADEMSPHDIVPAPRPLPAPLEAGESRRRMLAARRRLLGMLAALEIAALTLAVTGLAALWVVAPPTIMLAGYLLLLREAAQADAEQAQRVAAAAAASAAARARALARARREEGQRSGLPETPAEGTPLAASFAAAPVMADYEDSGRDFAPGLAGKYTPSSADFEVGAEDPYGYEEEPRFRRAVGD